MYTVQLDYNNQEQEYVFEYITCTVGVTYAKFIEIEWKFSRINLNSGYIAKP